MTPPQEQRVDARPLERTPNALQAFDALRERIGGRRVAALLDFDGTLSPIVESPGDALISEEMRRSVARLAQRCLVGVISGRGLEDVRSRVGLESIWLAGSHGFEIRDERGEDRSPPLAAADRKTLADAGERLRDELSDLPGVEVEIKPLAIAVHYRRASEEAAERAHEAVERIADEDASLRATGGKKIVELRPNVDWDKGRAVEAILDRAGFEYGASAPIYVGDDDTDADGFRSASERGGFGIAVGDRFERTIAAFRLDDVEQVRALLDRLAEALDAA